VRLLARLPPAKRGRLLHLRVEDHYVEVTTDRGSALVLLRLSDAVAETAGVPGLQVHRSHWVALDAVARAGREGGRPALVLRTGTVVLVSRSFLPAARAAGLGV
jgi:DNA-binding LytR/AlgR family response regulator